ncbi:magnesium transporter CorA family protein [Acinetobacter apis]|uniref:Mg2+ and Co2+ transporter CorA n=1 Tax=Acinetobacter apis TaxID=1229165 RepID=A0A217EHY9_9GAMM|nr:magnesium transporter CorA family protein [Acinetobacter apis]SNQ29806.1 Mg2+ and Co2+ transporter CorA [Acinetobacter apis]
MQTYYFYHHPNEKKLLVSKTPRADGVLNFIWLDCLRQDIVDQSEQWQNKIYQHTDVLINEFHVADILNIEHPCAFDAMEDYDFLVFRKLVTPDDQILMDHADAEQHVMEFGLMTTPVNFILTERVLVTVRERGNHSIQSYLERLEQAIDKQSIDQSRLRKPPTTPLNLALRLLNSMVDDYLGLRTPLTQRVEYWQTELLQGKQYFKQWQQLLQENMAFQHVENLCEEQIEILQDLRDETVEDYHHGIDSHHTDSLDLILVRINDLVSHIERIQKHTARLRNAIQSAIDLHFSAISNQTNENMRILAIITAIFAPLTLLTGMYGMNFETIPGLKSPEGFWVMVAAMLVTTVLLMLYFHQRHLVGRGEKSVIDLLSQSQEQKRINIFAILDIDLIQSKKRNR